METGKFESAVVSQGDATSQVYEVKPDLIVQRGRSAAAFLIMSKGSSLTGDIDAGGDADGDLVGSIFKKLRRSGSRHIEQMFLALAGKIGLEKAARMIHKRLERTGGDVDGAVADVMGDLQGGLFGDLSGDAPYADVMGGLFGGLFGDTQGDGDIVPVFGAGDPMDHTTGEVMSQLAAVPNAKMRFGQLLEAHFCAKDKRGNIIKGSVPKKFQAVFSSPGAALKLTYLRPILCNHAELVDIPSKATVNGSALADNFSRFEGTSPGNVNKIKGSPTNGNATIPLKASEDGHVKLVPYIMLSIRQPYLQSIRGSEITIWITGGKSENGISIDPRPWTLKATDARDDEMVFIAFPAMETASELSPLLMDVSSTSTAVWNITGLPADSQYIVTIPGINNEQYQALKKGLGLSSGQKRMITSN